MGRGKLQMEMIGDEKTRYRTFRNRSKGLKKKLHELSTLCDVEACMILYHGDAADGPCSSRLDVWPENRDEVERIINRYLNERKGADRKRTLDLSDVLGSTKTKVEPEKNGKSEGQASWGGIESEGLSYEKLMELLEKLDKKIEDVDSLIDFKKKETSLMSSEDEVFLRKILYDAVILGDYSFLKPEIVIQFPEERLRRLALTQLIVTHEAIEFLREHGDQTKPISYINAFSSHLSSQLVKWVSNQIGMEGKVNRPSGASPKALIKWLLNLEGQGVRIFDDSISRYRAKLVLDISKVDYDQSAGRADVKNLDDDLLFDVDKKREEEDGNEEDEETDDSMTAAFVSAARTMRLAEKDGGRKRKKGSSIEKNKQIKFQKYNLHGNSNSERESLQFRDGSLSSGSEIENPPSDDEDMELNQESD